MCGTCPSKRAETEDVAGTVTSVVGESMERVAMATARTAVAAKRKLVSLMVVRVVLLLWAVEVVEESGRE